MIHDYSADANVSYVQNLTSAFFHAAYRIPWGVQVTAERLIRIELAEKVVKRYSTGARQVRVRDIDLPG